MCRVSLLCCLLAGCLTTPSAPPSADDPAPTTTPAPGAEKQIVDPPAPPAPTAATGDPLGSTGPTGVSGPSGAPPAIALFTATPPSIASGGSATLTWTVTDATAVTLDGLLVTGTSAVVSPAATHTYTLVATGLSGSATAMTTVAVDAPPAPPVISSFTATPSTIGLGQSATLAWTVQDATSLLLDSVTIAGTQTIVTPNATATYTLLATGPGGTTSATATVTVAAIIAPGNPGSADYTTAIDTTQNRSAISPLIYGYNWYNASGPKNLTFDRLGGDRYCSYNWEINASSSGGTNWAQSDGSSRGRGEYFYINGSEPGAGPAGMAFNRIDSNRARNMVTMMLVPMGDYVAADTTGDYPTQTSTHYAGAVDILSSTYLSHFKALRYDTGVDPSVLPSAPNTTDAYSDVDAFVNYVRWHYSSVPTLFTDPTKRVVIGLDNEPELWPMAFGVLQRSATGDDFRAGADWYLNDYPDNPEIAWTPPPGDTTIGKKVTPDEFIARAKAMTTMLRRVVPNAEIIGPSHSGFDGMETFGGYWPPFSPSNWFMDKFLHEMQLASTVAGKRLLDAYNFHWYAQATSTSGTQVSNVATPADDAEFDAIVQGPRSYWDNTYIETSWITHDHTTLPSGQPGPIYMIPRAQTKIAANYPGTKLAVTEYYAGGGATIAGGISEADTLGVFGKYGIYMAAMWPIGSHSYADGGLKMFRDYDGAQSSFGDTSVRAVHSNTATGSAYASVDNGSDARVVVVLINKENAVKTTAVSVTHTRVFGKAKVYTLTQGNANPVAKPDITLASTNALVYSMPARSVTTLVFVP
jgi:hypothetical protein